MYLLSFPPWSMQTADRRPQTADRKVLTTSRVGLALQRYRVASARAGSTRTRALRYSILTVSAQAAGRPGAGKQSGARRRRRSVRPGGDRRSSTAPFSFSFLFLFFSVLFCSLADGVSSLLTSTVTQLAGACRGFGMMDGC
ncbi:hypothetical protein CALCODRAFT_289844 [Calocera cornea HHB12733]|uniref:Uncharacterized protein n=1 Tax=Calocera cornea HHB12733 TaxID=1353952 RepID=A0A165FS63_9BASI|nr:hypothetical protein CALCODRAFT_289844 [Calocera cornea HHB12733]